MLRREALGVLGVLGLSTLSIPALNANIQAKERERVNNYHIPYNSILVIENANKLKIDNLVLLAKDFFGDDGFYDIFIPTFTKSFSIFVDNNGYLKDNHLNIKFSNDVYPLPDGKKWPVTLSVSYSNKLLRIKKQKPNFNVYGYIDYYNRNYDLMSKKTVIGNWGYEIMYDYKAGA